MNNEKELVAIKICAHAVSSKLFTLQGELFGQLGCNVHAVLQPGQLGAGDALSVAAQAGSYTWLPCLALWVNSDDGGNWDVEKKKKRGRWDEMEKWIKTALTNTVVNINTTWAVRQLYWMRSLRRDAKFWIYGFALPYIINTTECVFSITECF